MTPDQYKVYRELQTERGARFQDLALTTLWHMGIGTVQHTSRTFQYARGESLGGLEVKYQSNLGCGTLYIEVGERSSVEVGGFTASGIYTGCSELVTGDYTVIYRLPVRMLRRLFELEEGGPDTITNSTGTSRGFKLSLADADAMAVQVLRPPFKGIGKTFLRQLVEQDRADGRKLAGLLGQTNKGRADGNTKGLDGGANR